jgi:hypothetical protein
MVTAEARLICVDDLERQARLDLAQVLADEAAVKVVRRSRGGDPLPQNRRGRRGREA